MERVGALISKLKEQYDQQADAAAIAVTAQMLVAELHQPQNNARTANGSYKKVSVIMPSVSANIKAEKKENNVVIEEKIAEPEVVAEQPKIIHKLDWMFDEMNDVPTLSDRKKDIFELNQTIAASGQSSMNEKLRVEKTELGNVLHETPVKDLKKAIGINDRYLFINELFRGDETMYERSIKTINSFSILPEAEFWILRELKLKLAWSENSDTVALFDQLIKRRFS
jgi:hypothetical protein